MKFSLNKKEFVEAVTIASRAIASKEKMPILSGIYINAKNNGVELQSTDYELGFIITLNANVEEEGEIVLSGKYLVEMARKLPGENVEFNYNPEEKIAHISSGSSNYRLISMKGDFPKIRIDEEENSINIKSNDLVSIIKKTTFAASEDISRPVFNGCLFDVAENNLTMVATNSHRLVLNKTTLNNLNNSIRLIIPAKALNELVYAVKEDNSGEIALSCSNNQLSFKFQNIYMVTSLIEGEYPDYRRVIPMEHQTSVVVDKDIFTSVIDRVSLISRYYEFHTINLTINQNFIHILSNNPEVGKAEEDIPAEVEGEELSISFNVKYLIDVLKIIDGDKIKFYFKGELSPVKLEDLSNPDFIYVLTPVRNQNY